jgi:hypothetical protein
MKIQTYFISYEPPYSQGHQKCDWTRVGGQNHLIGWTPSTDEPDWTRVGEWNHLIGWTPSPKKPDWTRVGEEKHLIGWTASPKKPDWTRVGEQKHLIGWTPSPKKPDWLNSQSRKTWLSMSIESWPIRFQQKFFGLFSRQNSIIGVNVGVSRGPLPYAAVYYLLGP